MKHDILDLQLLTLAFVFDFTQVTDISTILLVSPRKEIWVIDKVGGQNDWKLAKFFSCVLISGPRRSRGP